MKEYTEIEVTQDHIIDGVESCSQNCAIALALMDSELLSYTEWADVQGCEDIYKEFRIGNEYFQIGINIHTEDKELVQNFIEWYDEGLDCNSIKFRAKLEQKYERI